MNRQVVLFCATALVPASTLLADGFLVIHDHPRITGVYAVPYHQVNISVEEQVGRVQVKQAFRNPTSAPLEAEYLFPLPEDAAIDNFVMMVDGKELPGKLLGRDEARRIYENIVRQKKDPALLEYMGRGLFKTSVFPIPPGQQREVHISYSQLCKRDGNVVEILYPLGTEKYSAQPLNELKIDCHIKSKNAIKSIYSSTHDVNITRPNENEALVSLVQHNVLPRDDFALLYSVSNDEVGMSVLSYRPSTSEPGYFLLLASPRVEQAGSKILSKSLIFVLDKSGSMTGNKIEQARRSLDFVLKNLNPGDTFNIITYSDQVDSFAPELQKADPDSIARAREYVQRISAGGSTNIDGALRTAMDMLKAPEVPAYVIFLTDGLPTAGEQREPAIVNNCSKSNGVRARLMAFGVGDDVNARLLDKLTTRNFGDSHYVRPNEDIEGPISKLYTKLSAPVLSYVKVAFAGLDDSQTYPKMLPDLFKGNQLVVVGRYHQPGSASVTLSGKVAGVERRFSHTVQLDDQQAPYARSFVEKLWAERRIGYLIDEIDLYGRNQELIDEIVRLSTRYGILTPYTSFLAEEDVRLADVRLNNVRAGELLSALDTDQSGSRGVGQRVSKAARRRAARPAASAPAPSGTAGGAGGGRFSYTVNLEGQQQIAKTVLSLGRKTFFKKQGQWRDSTVTPEQEENAIRVVQFSDAYFKLIAQLPSTTNQYLTIEGELLLNLGGKTYLIVPEAG